MKRFLTLVAVAGGLLSIAPALRADTLADCGRFFLKYNQISKKMECVGGKRARPTVNRQNTTLARDLNRSLQQLQSVVGQAESLLQNEKLTQEVEGRIRALLSEARQRTREVQQQSRALEQEQRSRVREVAAEQRQFTQAQVQLARQLEQKQQTLTTQLLSEQRARTQELLKAPVVNN